jgi:hypothetical protein
LGTGEREKTKFGSFISFYFILQKRKTKNHPSKSKRELQVRRCLLSRLQSERRANAQKQKGRERGTTFRAMTEGQLRFNPSFSSRASAEAAALPS